MATYLLSSHDGYGLGHLRRNTLLARALLAAEPVARIVLVTGASVRPTWFDDARITVVGVPSLIKDEAGSYRSNGMAFEEALAAREQRFAAVVVATQPDVVVVDRHPFGTGGELRVGLGLARRQGAAIHLGLRDILDDPRSVADEIAGDGWANVDEYYDHALVYGSPALCDHEDEYAIPLPVRYCGWVTSCTEPTPISLQLVVVAAGGGADGDDVVRLGTELLLARSDRHAIVVAGPYAKQAVMLQGRARVGHRIRFRPEPDGCGHLFARAGAVVQMGGYNTTFEALGAGARPIIVPRRNPRREQVIRASRLATLGLADVVDSGVDGAEVAWLLDQPRRLAPGALASAGIALDGAERVAALLVDSARRGAGALR